MCLGVPGKVIEVVPSPLGISNGRVDFGGIVKDVCFAYTPDVVVGEYVVVHVGFAISKIDEAEAKKVFDYLTGVGELDELAPAPSGGPPGTGSPGGSEV